MRSSKSVAMLVAGTLLMGGVGVAAAAPKPDPCNKSYKWPMNSVTKLRAYNDCRFDRIESKIDALAKKVAAPAPTKAPKPTPTPTATPTPTVSPSPSPTSGTSPLPGDGGKFPVSVWLQDPAGNASDYKGLGVTTFLALWQWPSDEGKWPGWSQASVDELVKQGMNAYAGESVEAVKRTLEMPGQEQVISGWLAGDEPDMFGPDPAVWKQRIAALKQVQERPVAGNFGLGFGGFGWWYDHISDADRAAWCAPIDLPSVDYYGMTNPEPAANKGAWTYGRAIDNLRKACGNDKPLGAFVETSEMADTATAATPAGIKAAAWNAVIHGADSINWFVHDFKCNPECGAGSFLYEPKWAENRRAVKEVNTELHKWADVLATPDLAGTQKATRAGIPLHLLTKRHDGVTYVFAQAAGDSTRPGGYSGSATVTVNGKSWTDTWEPNEVRVYTAS